MGAEVYWTVNVLEAVEGIRDVKALTAEDAMKEAEQMPGVIKATSAYRPGCPYPLPHNEEVR